MRSKERSMVTSAEAHLESALDLVATILEGRSDDEDAIAYELGVLYTKINDCIDDAREVGYDI